MSYKFNRFKTYTIEERFFAKVKKVGGCWLWVASKNPYGYGCFMAWNEKRGKYVVTRAHRFSYELKNGKIPDGLFLRHTCDNPACVNPDHLLLGTQKDNIADMIARGRHLSGNKEGTRVKHSKLSPEEVIEIINLRKQGVRIKPIMSKYCVSRSAIYKICTGKIWAHLNEVSK